MKSKKLVMAIAASLALHAAVPEVAVRIRDLAPKYKDRIENMVERADSEIDKAKIWLMRKRLVAKARKDIKKGEFDLGKFILDAEKIDSEELGREYEYEKAQEILSNKISELQDLVEKGYCVQEAVPMILTEFDYYGFTEGMGNAIVDNGGNCEPASHYVASIVHGAGYEEDIYFRVYPKHIAPVFVEDEVEYDLTAGDYAKLSGVKFRPEKLVDFYAKRHGLDAPEKTGENDKVVASVASNKGFRFKDERSFRYPPVGGLPGPEPFSHFFSKNGVKKFRPTVRPRGKPEEGPGGESSSKSGNSSGYGEYDEAHMCLSYGPELEYELLNPIPYRVNPYHEYSMLVTPMEPKEQDEMDCVMLLIDVEKEVLAKTGSEAERLLHLAHLSGLYLDAHRQLSIMGKSAPAKKAFERRTEMEKEAKKILEKVEDKEKFMEELAIAIEDSYTYSSTEHKYSWKFKLWHLVFLGEAGVDFLFDMMQPGVKYDADCYYMLEDSLRVLHVFPPTRERAEKKMQEWIHSYDSDSLGDCNGDGRYDNDVFCDRHDHMENVDMPPGHAEPGELDWFLRWPPAHFSGLTNRAYIHFIEEVPLHYPPAARLTRDAGADETEAPDFGKLVKAVETVSKGQGCCADEQCKNIVLLEFGVRALFVGEGFLVTKTLYMSEISYHEREAELNFAREFREWLDDVDIKDPEAERVVKFMKEHIKKKYSL